MTIGEWHWTSFVLQFFMDLEEKTRKNKRSSSSRLVLPLSMRSIIKASAPSNDLMVLDHDHQLFPFLSHRRGIILEKRGFAPIFDCSSINLLVSNRSNWMETPPCQIGMFASLSCVQSLGMLSITSTQLSKFQWAKEDVWKMALWEELFERSSCKCWVPWLRKMSFPAEQTCFEGGENLNYIYPGWPGAASRGSQSSGGVSFSPKGYLMRGLDLREAPF